MQPIEKDVILILADISGYTKFMTENRFALTHSTVIIRELIHSIIKEVEIPLQVKEIEGDAVFLYALKDSDQKAWEESKKLIGEKLVVFMQVFNRKVVEFAQSNLCLCLPCKNVDKLKLKIIAHSGRAAFYRIHNLKNNIAGYDVILVHRLLKNSVKSNQYILLTKQAYDDLHIPSELTFVQGSERYDEIGEVATYVHYENQDERASVLSERVYSGLGVKIKNLGVKTFKGIPVALRLFRSRLNN